MSNNELIIDLDNKIEKYNEYVNHINEEIQKTEKLKTPDKDFTKSAWLRKKIEQEFSLLSLRLRKIELKAEMLELC